MLDPVETIYETLYSAIVGLMGDDLPTFSKGFVKGELGFPYMFLDQPETSPLSSQCRIRADTNTRSLCRWWY